MSSAKIVGIRGGEEMAQGYHTQARPLATPLVKLRELSKQKVHALLRKLFENADDALFAMADKAGSNGDQALFFDAMRELRLQKKHIATHVLKGLIKSFNELGHYRNNTQSNGVQETQLEELSVLQNDELEMKVAIEGMVNRSRNACSQALEDLCERCESLMAPMQLNPDQTPVSPEILADCFGEGIADLDIGIRARLVVLKLFEKYVLSEMPAVYSEANSLLIQQGVLPEIRKHRQQRKQQTTQRHAWPQETRANQNVHHDEIPILGAAIPTMQANGGLEDLRALMHSGPSEAATETDFPMLSEVYYSQQELISALSQFQVNAPAQIQGNNSAKVIDFRGLLDQRLAAGQCTSSYNEVDADIINLVSMLFEFILEDRQLQPTMKVLIGRLQIPILKVAIMDRSFFNKGGHPARKLLNEIASAAIGWNEVPEGKIDRLRNEIEKVVEAIIESFNEDLSLFDELLTRFTRFMDQERRRGQLVEQRTKDSEQGKAASDNAKLQVQNFLNDALAKAEVSASIVELLREGWSKVMIIHHLKNGEESKEWYDSCRTVQELLWTLAPQEKGVEPSVVKQSLLQRIPAVNASLTRGLEDVAFDEFRRKELLHELEAQHVQILQQLDLEIEAGEVRQREYKAVAELIRETEELESIFEADQPAAQVPEPAVEQEEKTAEVLAEAGQQPSQEALVSEDQAAKPPAEEIVLVDPASVATTSATLSANDPFGQQVEHFAVGCWFEFSGEDKSERCKLAAVIKATGKYIFVNRSGIKVAEKTKAELAQTLRQGHLQVLNDGLLFDRALESIITNLRGKQDEA